MNEKMYNGLMKASPEKRYKSFLNTVVDMEEVWILDSEEGCATLDFDGYIHILLWPRKEVCECLRTEGETPLSVGIDEFLEEFDKLGPNERFMIFPTEEDGYSVSADKLYADICEHLDEVE